MLAMATSLLTFTNVYAADDFDTVINNGRVIDPETGLDAVRNVGIKDGSIAAISEFPLTGATTINALPESRSALAHHSLSKTERLTKRRKGLQKYL